MSERIELLREVFMSVRAAIVGELRQIGEI